LPEVKHENIQPVEPKKVEFKDNNLPTEEEISHKKKSIII